MRKFPALVLAFAFLFYHLLSISYHLKSFAALPSSVLFLSHFDNTTKNERDGDLGTSSGISFSSGKFSQGVKFDGTDHLYYSSTGNISPSEGTVEFWYKPSDSWDSEEDPQVQLFHYDNNNQDTGWSEDWISIWGVKHPPPNQPLIYAEIGVGGAGQTLSYIQSVPWQAGSLHHVAITWSSSAFRLYTDGSLRGQFNNPSLPSSRDTIFVGCDMYWEYGYVGDGVIDELLIVDYAKSGSEIEADYQATEPFYTEPPPAPPPTCSCGTWSSWKNGACGGGGCAATERQQSRTRDCNPAGCQIESESRCTDDFACLAQADKEPPRMSWGPYALVYKAKNITLTGRVSDNQSGVASLSYTLDGTNFIPMGVSDPFKIRLKNLADGNYRLRVKASDRAGNEALSVPARFTIDTLPPRLGGNAFFLGPQKLFPGKGGFLSIPAGSSVAMAISAVGGPTTVVIKAGESSSSLQPISGTRLWQGRVVFEEEGSFDLEAISVDGAGNKVTRTLTPLQVLGKGKVVDPSGEPVEGAEVSLYLVDSSPAEALTLGVSLSTPGVEKWEGEIYGQTNPQTTDGEGGFSYLLPAGTYQLRVRSSQYREFISEPFTISAPTAFNPEITLQLRPGITLFGRRFSLPWFLDFFARRRKVALEFPTPGVEPTDLGVGKRAPGFTLPSTLGGTTSLGGLVGRKVLITFWASWDPLSVEQIGILDKLAVPRGVVFLPLALQESVGKAAAFLKRGGYLLPSLADETGAILESYRALSLPQHILVGKDGRIEEVKVGVLSEEEVLELIK